MALVIGNSVKILILIFCVENVLSQTAEYQECADPLCSRPIALGETTQSYSAIKKNGLSFPGNAKVEIFSKGGEDIVIELSGKRGYVPSRLIKENKVLERNLINVTKEDISAHLFQNLPPPAGTQVPVQTEGHQLGQAAGTHVSTHPEGHQLGQAAGSQVPVQSEGHQPGQAAGTQAPAQPEGHQPGQVAGTQVLAQPEGHQPGQAAGTQVPAQPEGHQPGQVAGTQVLAQPEGHQPGQVAGTQVLAQPEGHQPGQVAETQVLVQSEGHQHEQVAGTQVPVPSEGSAPVQPEGHQFGQAAAQGSQQGIGQVPEQGTQQLGDQNEKPVVEVQDSGGTTLPSKDIHPSSVSHDPESTHSPPSLNDNNNIMQSPVTDMNAANLPTMLSTGNGPPTRAASAENPKYTVIEGTTIPLDFESEATSPSPIMPSSTMAPEGIYSRPTVNMEAVALSHQSNAQVTESSVDKTENLVNSQPMSAELNITPTNSPMLTDGQPETVQSNHFVPSASSSDSVKDPEPLTNTVEGEEEPVKTEESSNIIGRVKDFIISSISSAESEDEDEENSDVEATLERPESGLPAPVEGGNDLPVGSPENSFVTQQQQSEPVPTGEPPLQNTITDQQQKLEDSGSKPESLQDKSVETISGADVRPVTDSFSAQGIQHTGKAAGGTPNLQTLSDHAEVSSAVLSETSGASETIHIDSNHVSSPAEMVMGSSQTDVNTPEAKITANNPHKQGEGESEIKTENLGQEQSIDVTENPNTSKENEQDSGSANENVNKDQNVTNNNINTAGQPEVSQEIKEELSKANVLDSAVSSIGTEGAANTGEVPKEKIENTDNSGTSTNPNQPANVVSAPSNNPNPSHSSVTSEEQRSKHQENIPGDPLGNSNSPDSVAHTEEKPVLEISPRTPNPPPNSDTNKVETAANQEHLPGTSLTDPNPPPNTDTNQEEKTIERENEADTTVNNSNPSLSSDVNTEEIASKEQMVEHHENKTDTASDSSASNLVSNEENSDPPENVASGNPNSSQSTITDQQANASEDNDLSSENGSTNEDNHYETNNDIPSNTPDDLRGQQKVLEDSFPTTDSSLPSTSSENPRSEDQSLLNRNDDDVGNSEDEKNEDSHSASHMPKPQARSQSPEENLDEFNYAHEKSANDNVDTEEEMEEENIDSDEPSEHNADYNDNANSDIPNYSSDHSAEDEEVVDPSEGDPSVYESSEHEGSNSHYDKDYTESNDGAEFEQESLVQVTYIEMLRSYLDTVISLIPDPLYSALEELGMKGMSPRVTIFTAFTGILTLILISTGLFIKRGSQEGFLKGKLCVTEGKLYKLTAEKQVIRDELELSRKRVNSLEESLDGAQTALNPLKEQLKISKDRVVALESLVSSLQEDLESSADAGLSLNKMLSDLLTSQNQFSKIYASFQDVKEKMATQQEAVEALRADLVKKEQEISTETSERQKALVLVDSLKLKILKCEDQLSETLEEVSRYSTECSELKNQNAKLMKESEQQQKQAKKLEKRLETAQTQLDQSQKTQKQLEESLSQKEEEIMTLKTALRLVESLKPSLESTEGEVSLAEDNLKQLLEVSEITVKLEKFEEENKKLITELESEKENSANLQDQFLKAEEISKSMLESNKTFQQEKIKAVTELEVLTNYFKETEMRMQKELGAQEAWLQQKAENATSADKKAAESQQQAAEYKAQIKSLKEELESTERSYKNQVAAQEKKAHENWLGARAAERKLEDSKQECAGLRQRLIVLERDLESLKNSSDSIIRPIPKRPGASGNEQLYPEESQVETSSSSLLSSSGKIEELDLAKPRMVPFAPLPMPPMPLPPPFPPPMYSSLPPPPFMPPPFGEPFGPPPPEPWKLPPHNFERGRRSPTSSKGPPSPPYSSRNASRQSSPPLLPRRMDDMSERANRTFSPSSSSSSRDCRDGGSPPLDLHPRLFDLPPRGGGYRGPTHPPPPPYMDRVPPPGMQGPHRDHSTSHLYTDTPPDKRRGGPDMTTSSPRPPRSSTSPERRNNGPATTV